ncbi:MAG: PorT family protein [Prevotellaceae bacterium]|jgi:hypothetical protein|nr:PorT family protein [Prevotellaceae bacterium]
MKKILCINIFLILLSINAFGQLGLRFGINSAEQVRKFVETPSSFTADKLTSFQAGVVWQSQFRNSGFATEIGAIYSQKGSYYNYTNAAGSEVVAIDELNYVEIPLNIRFTLLKRLPFNIYGAAGVYFAYLLDGKTTDENSKTSAKMTFARYADRLDMGVSTGAGVQLFNKIQLGATWSWGMRNTSHSTADIIKSFKNKNISINLTYIF